jgi:hypothetical protein
VRVAKRGTYRTALIFGNPLKTTKLIVTAGFMWAPDVAPHAVRAKITPQKYAKPIWSTAGSFEIREVPLFEYRGTDKMGWVA